MVVATDLRARPTGMALTGFASPAFQARSQIMQLGWYFSSADHWNRCKDGKWPVSPLGAKPLHSCSPTSRWGPFPSQHSVPPTEALAEAPPMAIQNRRW
jgi:hypothetical protein